MEHIRLPGNGLEPALMGAGIDYVRLTSRAGDENEHTLWVYQQAAIEILAAVDGEAPDSSSWGAMGYSGRSYGPIQCGVSPQGLIFQASGWAADQARALDLPWSNCSRVDVQITAWYEASNVEQIRVWANRAHSYARARGASGRMVRLVEGYERGCTAYIGSRRSDCFIRIYDKSGESGGSGEYENAIRFEVEYKGDRAGQVWEAFGSPTASQDAMAELVSEEVRRAGLVVPGLHTGKYTLRPTAQVVRPTNAGRLSWLEHQVSGTVKRLLSAGYKKAYLRSILGLD